MKPIQLAAGAHANSGAQVIRRATALVTRSPCPTNDCAGQSLADTQRDAPEFRGGNRGARRRVSNSARSPLCPAAAARLFVSGVAASARRLFLRVEKKKNALTSPDSFSCFASLKRQLSAVLPTRRHFAISGAILARGT